MPPNWANRTMWTGDVELAWHGEITVNLNFP